MVGSDITLTQLILIYFKTLTLMPTQATIIVSYFGQTRSTVQMESAYSMDFKDNIKTARRAYVWTCYVTFTLSLMPTLLV